MKTTLFSLILLFFFAACEDKSLTQDQNPDGDNNPLTTPNPNGTAPAGGKIYLIKKGNHYHSGIDLSIAPRSQHGWQVYFFEDTIYTSSNPTNQHDINKLVGTTDCWSIFSNHNNSARFGWNWDPATKMMKIHAYTYVDKERQWAYITSIPTKTTATLSLSVDKAVYTFQVNNVTVKMPRGCDRDLMTGLGQYPYFGGDETAPHDMHIWLKTI